MLINRNRPAHPVVYTTSGTYIAAAYTGRCAKCLTTYSTSYYYTQDGKQHFHSHREDQQYFEITSHTVFEIELLRQLTAQLIFSAASFESQAEVYNTVHSVSDQLRLSSFVTLYRRSNIHVHADGYDWQLNVTRLEDG